MPGGNNPNNTKKNNSANKPAKRRGVTFRNNVNVRNVIYTRKNNNSYNVNIKNSKNTVRLENGPGNYKHVRNSNNLGVSPEWGVGETYYTGQSMAKATAEMQQMRAIFGDKWDDAEVVLEDHPELVEVYNTALKRAETIAYKRWDDYKHKALSLNELPHKEVVKLFKHKMDRVKAAADEGRITAKNMKSKISDLKLGMNLALDNIDPVAEASYTINKSEHKKYLGELKKAASAKFKDIVVSLIK